MTTTRHTYFTEVELGGDTPTACFEVEVEYTVNWGRPARTYGRPEDCYMGDPDEIGSARVVTINGQPRPWPNIHGGIGGPHADDDLSEMILLHIEDVTLLEAASNPD